MKRRDFVTGTMAVAGAVASGLSASTAAEVKSESNRTIKNIIRKAVVSGMAPGDMPMTDRFKMLKDVGFDGIELYPMEPKQIDEARVALEKSGLIAHSVMNSLHWKYPLTSPREDEVEKSLKGMEQSLRTAHALGCETVLLVPGVVTPEVRYEQCFERSSKNIKKLLPLAEELKVIIALEEVWNKWLQSPIEMRDFVDSFKSDYVKSYFDVGNIVQNGYPQDWIMTLGKRIKKLHVKDYDEKTRQWKNLKEGTIDWKAVRQALLNIGYNGWMSAELPGGDKNYLADVSKRMDEILAGV